MRTGIVLLFIFLVVSMTGCGFEGGEADEEGEDSIEYTEDDGDDECTGEDCDDVRDGPGLSTSWDPPRTVGFVPDEEDGGDEDVDLGDEDAEDDEESSQDSDGDGPPDSPPGDDGSGDDGDDGWDDGDDDGWDDDDDDGDDGWDDGDDSDDGWDDDDDSDDGWDDDDDDVSSDPDLQCADDDDICRFCGPAEDVVTECPPGDSSYECQVLELVNEIRVDEGLDELDYNSDLAHTAMIHAMDLSLCDYFAHDSLDGTSFFERCAQGDYDGTCTGENIGGGQQTPQDVVDAWMDSPGHKENILYPAHEELGVAYHLGDGTYTRYWVKAFGRP